MAIRIHPLRLSDYDAMIELFRICGLDPRTRGRDAKAAIARQLRSNRASYLGAFDGTRLVGTVLGTHDTRKAWINRLAVHPKYRRRGIAKSAYTEIDSHPKSSTFDVISMVMWKITPHQRAKNRVFGTNSATARKSSVKMASLETAEATAG